MIYKVYERVERQFEGKIFSACLISKNGYSKELKPFIYAPISVEYDIEGIEHIKKNDKLFYAIRFSFLEEGEYHLEIKLKAIKPILKILRYVVLQTTALLR